VTLKPSYRDADRTRYSGFDLARSMDVSQFRSPYASMYVAEVGRVDVYCLSRRDGRSTSASSVASCFVVFRPRCSLSCKCPNLLRMVQCYSAFMHISLSTLQHIWSWQVTRASMRWPRVALAARTTVAPQPRIQALCQNSHLLLTSFSLIPISPE
jgi:hypothetical protein